MNITQYSKQQGFTLIEILAVVVIISISISVIVLSVNSVRQSANEIFSAQLENNINANKTFAKRYNKAVKVEINTDKKIINFYWLDAFTSTWNINTTIPAMDFSDLTLASTRNNIIIKPNGFIDTTTITITSDARSSEVAF